MSRLAAVIMTTTLVTLFCLGFDAPPAQAGRIEALLTCQSICQGDTNFGEIVLNPSDYTCCANGCSAADSLYDAYKDQGREAWLRACKDRGGNQPNCESGFFKSTWDSGCSSYIDAYFNQ